MERRGASGRGQYELVAGHLVELSERTGQREIEPNCQYFMLAAHRGRRWHVAWMVGRSKENFFEPRR